MSFGRLPAICFVSSAARPENAVTSRIIFGDSLSRPCDRRTAAPDRESSSLLAELVLSTMSGKIEPVAMRVPFYSDVAGAERY